MIKNNVYMIWDTTIGEITRTLILFKNDDVARKQFRKYQQELVEKGLDPNDFKLINLGQLHIEFKIEGKEIFAEEKIKVVKDNEEKEETILQPIFKYQPYLVDNVPTDIIPEKNNNNSNDTAEDND